MPRKSVKSTASGLSLDFSALVDAVRQVHQHYSTQASRAVNVSLTLRNWLIGYYIREYEQNGADRAQYGESLVDKVAERLAAAGLTDLTARYLRLCRQLAAVYPEIWRSLTTKSGQALFPHPIWRSMTAKSSAALNVSIRRPMTPELRISVDAPIVETSSPQLTTPVEKLLASLSFTHLSELIAIDDPLKRTFYEFECIRGNWSVRALKRQIASLYFERSGLSTDKEKLARLAHAVTEQAEPKLAIRDPYIFEFLGLKAKEAVAESDLEDALLDNLQEFLLELGHGFCLEARQKSIVIGNTRGFIDLVFYHRILKCHVLVELKVDEFTHEHLGQLNTYVNWYRRHMMIEDDNPPVGLLLCTQKDHALVEYALAGIDNRLFVSKYQLELPSKEDLQRFIEEKRREVGDEA